MGRTFLFEKEKEMDTEILQKEEQWNEDFLLNKGGTAVPKGPLT